MAYTKDSAGIEQMQCLSYSMADALYVLSQWMPRPARFLALRNERQWRQPVGMYGMKETEALSKLPFAIHSYLKQW